MTRPTGARGKILVVDDEEEIRILLYTLLSDAGYEVRLAADAEMALDFLKEQPAEACITDLRMPGMDGLEFIEATWAFPLRPQVIMLTGYASVDVAVEAARLGIVQLCEKPFFSDHLLSLVERAVSEFRHREDERNEFLHLGTESARLLADAKRVLAGLRNRLAAHPTDRAEPALAGEKTISFGPPGVVRLAHAVVIVDVVPLEGDRSAAGLFVDDDGRAASVVVRSPLDPDGTTVPLRKIPQGIGFAKLRPVSSSGPTYLHVLDADGNLLRDLSCVLHLSRRCMEPLGDPFEILGLPRAATPDQIRQAYRDLAERYRPETAPPAMRGATAEAACAVMEAYGRLAEAIRVVSAPPDPTLRDED